MFLHYRYPAINKPAGVVHWLKHSKDAQNVDWVVILDADMMIRGPILPWEIGLEKGRPVAAYYGHKLRNYLSTLAPMWLSKTEEVREDTAHWSTNITGDIYGKGWISEMYGYSFGATEHHEDDIVYDCGRLFPEPPFPREVKALEPDKHKVLALFLNLECINTLNQG
ncbi:hypothetical protein L2E82_35606 [Cichorium intybus]|uniref:Uncharacterized protein n=1 Tax=Cichorium intybus TaxID=13427 RepID=A0ACB9BPA4_CICIN|nr:hypothetical protein L2E82_35606 [Cichorium intybus]